jgi:hypothetical protein
MAEVPSHLVGWMNVRGVSAEETLEGDLRCPCGSETLEFHWAGTDRVATGPRQKFAVRAICVRCGREHLLFDSGLHGWDVLLSARRHAAPCALPFHPWHCPACAASGHRGTIRLTVVPDARDLALFSAGKIDPSQRNDAFTDLTMDLTCSGCGRQTPAWAHYQMEGYELTHPFVSLSMELTVLWDGVRIGRVAVKKRNRRHPTLFGVFVPEPGPAGPPALVVEALHLVEKMGTESAGHEEAIRRYNEIGDQMHRHVRLAELPGAVERFDFDREGVWIALDARH